MARNGAEPWFYRDGDGCILQGELCGLAKAKMVWVDGAYHFIMLDQPEKFLEQVDVFLK